MCESRNVSIDICRGLTMICVVLGHCGFPFTHDIYAFHVPAFFIISGLLYNYGKGDKKYIKDRFLRRTRRLYSYYIAFSLFFLATYNIFISYNIYVTDEILQTYPDIIHGTISHYMGVKEILIEAAKILCFSGGSQLGGALWFVRALFFTCIIIDIESLLIGIRKSRVWIMLLINLLLFVSGYIFNLADRHLPFGIEVSLVSTLFFTMGLLIQKFEIAKYVSKINSIVLFVSSIVSLFIIHYLAQFQFVNIGLNQYDYPVLMIITTIIGFIMLYMVSVLFSHIPYLNTGLSYVGKHTIAILGWHFLSFKIVTLVALWLNDLPIGYLASFPFMRGVNWVWYVLTGTLIPLSISALYFKIREVFVLNKNK